MTKYDRQAAERCQVPRARPCNTAWGPQWPPWGTPIPTPRPLAFSCRNFRNFVRKMYLEASPFREWENQTVRS